MAQTIKIKRGGLGNIQSSTPTTSKGELVLGTGSLANGLSTSLFVAEADNTLKLSHGRIDSVSDGQGLAGNIGSNTAFTGLLIHSASDNKFYRYDGSAFQELPISAGSADNVAFSLTDGNGINNFTFDGSSAETVSIQLNGSTLFVDGTGLKVNTDGITSTEIANGAVVSESIANEAVGINHLTSSIAGDGLVLITTPGTQSIAAQAANNTVDIGASGISVPTGSITNGGAHLVNAGAIFSLSSSIASDIVSNTGNVEGVSGQVAYFDATNSVSGSAGFTFANDVLTVDGSTFGENVTIAGDLTVNGSTTTISSTEVEIGDRILTLNTALAAGNAGLHVHDTTGGQTGSFTWDATGNYWLAGTSGSGVTDYRIAEQAATGNLTNNKLVVADASGRLEASAKFEDDGTNGIITNPKLASFNGSNADGVGILYENSGVVGAVTAEGTDELAHVFGTKTNGELVFSNVIDGGTF